MPCCAFAAFLFSQLVLGLAVIKRVLFGRSEAADGGTNATVEWRLDAPPGAVPVRVDRTFAWSFGRGGLAIFALAAVVEVALLFGAVYSLRAHAGYAHHHHMAGAADSP